MDKKEIYTKLLYFTISWDNAFYKSVDENYKWSTHDHVNDKTSKQFHEVVRHLIELGADLNYTRPEDGKKSLLHFLTRDEHFEVIKDLVAAGIDIEAKDEDGETALFKTAYYPNLPLLRFLLKLGADINTRNSFEETMLHAAVGRIGRGDNLPDSIEVIKFLIAKGLDVNATDKKGNTPLHTTCWGVYKDYSNLDVIKALIQNGADINVKNNEGRTPLDIAKHQIDISEGLMEVLNLLQGEKK